MAGRNLKSISITNRCQSVVFSRPAKAAGHGLVNDYVTTVSADDNTSTYRMVRIPTTAKIKKVVVSSAAVSAGAADLGVAYSDNSQDGTQPSLAALTNAMVIIPTLDNKLFAAATSIVAVAQADWTFLGTTKPMQNIPLWQVLISAVPRSSRPIPAAFDRCSRSRPPSPPAAS
jgi:hypothetical protein